MKTRPSDRALVALMRVKNYAESQGLLVCQTDRPFARADGELLEIFPIRIEIDAEIIGEERE